MSQRSIEKTYPADGNWHDTGLDIITVGQKIALIVTGTNFGNQLPQVSSQVTVQARDDGRTGRGSSNTGVSVAAGQRVRISATGRWTTNRRWGWWGPEGKKLNCCTTILHSRTGYKQRYGLVARVGRGRWHYIGKEHTFTADASGTLYACMDDVGFNDNRGQLQLNITLPQSSGRVLFRIGNHNGVVDARGQYNADAPTTGGIYVASNGALGGTFRTLVLRDPLGVPSNGGQGGGSNGSGGCESHHREATADNPIQLRTGVKVFSVTDLSLNHPSQALSFTRHYNQKKLTDSHFAFMGLGWSHNHMYQMQAPTGTSPNREVDIYLPDGGRLSLEEDTTNHFKAKAGSTAELAYVNSEYVLTLPSQAVVVFEGTTSHKLNRREWPNGDRWTYTYDGNNKLTQVADDYGRTLSFSYYTGETRDDAYKNGQLKTVSDSADRSITLGYLPEKENGVIKSSPKALLASITDVRAQVWTYDYYGQDVGENDNNQRNFLTRRESPMLGTERLILEDLRYTMSGSTIAAINQKRGNNQIETDFTFQPDGLNLTEVTFAKDDANHELKTIHHFAGGVYVGTRDPRGNTPFQVTGDMYRPTLQGDANGNYTQLEWSADGRTLAGVTDAGGNPTRFAYNANHTLQSSTDAQGRKTDYTYGDSANPRQPTIIKVLDGTSVLRQQTFSYDSKGRTTEERLIDPDDGTTVLQKTTRVYATSGTGHGLLESVTQVDLTNAANNISTTYTYDSAGRVIKTQKSSLLGSCQFTYSVYDDAGNVLATVCGRESATIPTTVAAARALYDATDPAKFTVTTHAYDALGRRTQTTTQAGSPSEQTTRTVYDALDRVTRTIDNYVASASVPNPATAAHSAFDHGSDANQNRVTDTAYNARGLVRSQTDVLGHVTLIGYDAAGRLVKTVQSASQPSYNNDYTGTAADPDLSAYTASSNPDQDAITQQVYDANGNLVQTIDPSGQSHFTVYDALNRPVKTIRSAKAAASITLNPGATGANDPRSDDYAPSTDPDRDQIATTEYDALGRVIRTRRLLENRPSAIWETTLYGYDTLGRQVKVIRSAATPDYDLAADPDLSAYTAADAADQDLISTTTYDNQGRVSDPTDVNGAQTRYVYDGLNRQVKTVNNYVVQGTSDPAAWVWDGRWERASTGDVAVEHGAANDQNHISQTVYDSDGRVQSTRDVAGRTTYTVYDASSRPIRRIANYVPSGTTDPAAWVWSTANSRWEDGTGTAIPRGTNADQNTITETVYNNEGQVQQTIDGRRNVSYNLYDETGRQVIRIGNYVAQGTTNPKDWRWNATANRWESSAGQAVDHGPANDQNTITHTTYDLAGRVRATRAAAGIETRYTYDKLGRRIKTVHNYVDGVFDAAHPDQDLISQTTYNKAGQVIQTSDARGTKTTFSYDAAGRRLTVTQAAGTYLETTNYTCYDKAGRVLRTIQNWQATRISPDARRPDGTWQFNPRGHGSRNDRNLITAFAYDAAGRRTKVTDPAGNTTTTTYDKDGSVNSTTDAEGTVSAYRYDGLRRRNRVIQNYVAQGTSDPADWVWHETRSKWERSATDATAIAHNTANDQNVIVQVTHDLAGRITSLRDPRGNLTRYEYDGRNRRTKRTNPLANEWSTAYADLSNGGTRTTQTYPGLSVGYSYDVTREFDRLGRLKKIGYGDPATTYDIDFSYDQAGNRVKMAEYNNTRHIAANRQRETTYSYDAARRLTSVGFDSNGDGTVDETVRYSYDAGGLRTQMTLPGSKTITYSYDEVGRLIGLTAWGNQHSDFHYDKAGRHVSTQRPNGLSSDYAYNPAGHLRRVRHRAGSSLRGQFNYTVDGRGNRTRAYERVAQSTTASATYNKAASQVTFPRGTWTDDGAYKKTTQFSSQMQIAYTGDEALLTIGTGPDHGQFDLYINDNYWRRFDAYATTPAERVIHLPEVTTPQGKTTGKLSIKVRSDRHHRSTGRVFRFKQLAVIDTTYNERTIDYTYDGLSRLLTANYDGGTVEYTYGYDLAGNLTNMNGATRTYNAANQMTNDGTHTLTYDANGNLTSDGTNTYTWDRANRMLTAPNNTSYKYDGLNNRISQSIGTTTPTVTQYLLDTQPGLTKVLAATTGANTERYIHAPRGIHSMENTSGDWTYAVQDGLGSVRSEIDSTLGVNAVQSYNPYGVPDGNYAPGFGFTGEQTDSNGQLYLRARYYNPSLGVFNSRDPFEGITQRPMSLNGYSWVEGNPIMHTDPTGMGVNWNKVVQDPLDFLLSAFRFNNIISYTADLYHTDGLSSANPEDFGLVLLIGALNRYKCQNGNADRSWGLEAWLRLFANGVDISRRRPGWNLTDYLRSYVGANPDSSSRCADLLTGAISCTDPTVSKSLDFQNTLVRNAFRKCLPLPAHDPSVAVPALSGTLDGLLYESCPTWTPSASNHKDDDFGVVVVGTRIDFSASAFLVGADVNVEFQLVPHHLIDPQYWFNRPAFGIVINGGYEGSYGSVGANVGMIFGMLESGSFGEHTATNYTAGSSVVPLFIGPDIEADVSVAETSLIIFVGSGIGMGGPTAYAGTSSSFFVDPGESIRDVVDKLYNTLFPAG